MLAKKKDFNDRQTCSFHKAEAAPRLISVSSTRKYRSYSWYSTFQLKASSEDLFMCLVVNFVPKKKKSELCPAQPNRCSRGWHFIARMFLVFLGVFSQS